LPSCSRRRVPSSERGQELVYTRHHPRTGETAEKVLTGGEREKVERTLAPIQENEWEYRCSHILLGHAERENIRPLDLIWFSESPEGLRLTRAGKEAVAGVILGDPSGLGFEYASEKRERERRAPLFPEISLDRARIGAAMEFAEREATVLAPEPEPEGRPSLVAVLPPAPAFKSDTMSHVAFAVDQKPWTMNQTGAQWRRWNGKAEAWRDNEHLRRVYDNNVSAYWGRPGSGEIIAMLDPLITGIHRSFPNPVTGFLMETGRLYEAAMKNLPIRVRDDFWDYMRRWRSQPDAANDPTQFNQAVGLEPPVDPGPEFTVDDSEPGFFRDLYRTLHPRVALRVNPRLGSKEPGAKLGARLSAEYGPWRFRCGGDFDTRDQEAQGYAAIACDW
jgi:hypothetical protein